MLGSGVSVSCCSSMDGTTVWRGAGVASDGVGLWGCAAVVIVVCSVLGWWGVSAGGAGPGHVADGGLCGAWVRGEVAV